MASLTLRNIPEGLHRQLREAASRNRRSLNGEVIARLEAQLATERRTAEVDRSLRRLRARLPAVDHDQVESLKREGRP